jgi:hypothetical protein
MTLRRTLSAEEQVQLAQHEQREQTAHKLRGTVAGRGSVLNDSGPPLPCMPCWANCPYVSHPRYPSHWTSVRGVGTPTSAGRRSSTPSNWPC